MMLAGPRETMLWRWRLVIGFGLTVMLHWSSACLNGQMVRGVCVCDPGWTGANCTECTGRTRLNGTTGYISDGPGTYSASQGCNWLVVSGSPNSSIWLTVEHLALECIWDALYIFDGDSVDSPLLGSLSGFLTPLKSDLTASYHPFIQTSGDQLVVAGGLLTDANATNSSSRPPMQLLASSGMLYIYFFADAGYSSSGFNLSYSISPCPGEPECSGNGQCMVAERRCVCSAGWTAVDCSLALCHESRCEMNGGTCSPATGRCDCPPGRQGVNCAYRDTDAHWRSVATTAAGDLNWRHQGRASHSMVVYRSRFYVFGGFAANVPNFFAFEPLIVFDPSSGSWSVPSVNSLRSTPTNRYGHTAVLYENVMLVFGGQVDGTAVNELWSLNLTVSPLEWQRVVPGGDVPIAVAMHTATLVESTMVVMWGFGTDGLAKGYIQYYDIATNKWNTSIYPSGSYRPARYGHSAVYNAANRKIMVFSRHGVAGAIEFFDPFRVVWSSADTVLGGPHSILHSMILGPVSHAGDLVLVAGGCHYNDSGRGQRGSLCHSNELWLFDMGCRQWLRTIIPDLAGRSSARFGHTAVFFDGGMWVFGGYDGTYRNDLVQLTYASCSAITNSSVCLVASNLWNCVWQSAESRCVDASVVYNSSVYSQRACQSQSTCPLAATCSSCVGFANCTFTVGGRQCTAITKTPVNTSISITQPAACTSLTSPSLTIDTYLGNILECAECKSRGGLFTRHTKKCMPASNIPPFTCPAEMCHGITSCRSCVASGDGCFWCPSLAACLPSSNYESRYPYSECLRWVDGAVTPGGICPETRCSSFRNCSLCMDGPGCGWCGDGSGTGTGRCYAGGLPGPTVTGSTWYSSIGPNANLTQPFCPASRWSYDRCPACQCNGRSLCNSSDVCMNCTKGTVGQHCEHCKPGTYAPIHLTNQSCMPCDCNGHGKSCHDTTGHCTCEDSGTEGVQCDKCFSLYSGNATNGGLCFRWLTVRTSPDSTSTFSQGPFPNRRLQFICSPTLDKRVVFQISMSVAVKFNMTIEYSNRELVGIQYGLSNSRSTASEKFTFSHHEYNFDGIDKIRVYLSNLPTDQPLNVTVIFYYEDTIDILIVFATFFGCFLSLLLLAMAFWYVRQYIQTRLARRNRRRELIEMAQRPYGTLKMKMDGDLLPSKASPMVVQPLGGNDKVAMCTFAMRLPGRAASDCDAQSRFLGAATMLSIKKQSGFRHRATHNRAPASHPT